MEIQVLGPAEESALKAFLDRHFTGTMFMQANLHRAGIGFRHQTYGARYVGAVRDGRLYGVAAHCWNGMLLVEIPMRRLIGPIVERAMRFGDLPLTGIFGPPDAVRQVHDLIGASGGAAGLDGRQLVFALDLDGLRMPAALASGRVRVDRARPDEFERLVDWACRYEAETLGTPDGTALRARIRDDLGRLCEAGHQWVASVDGRPVSQASLNAAMPGRVQVGGVWTPPDLRCRGYGRAVVAGMLGELRREGCRHAVLFTQEDNRAARAAYGALGFRPAGARGLVLYS